MRIRPGRPGRRNGNRIPALLRCALAGSMVAMPAFAGVRSEALQMPEELIDELSSLATHLTTALDETNTTFHVSLPWVSLCQIRADGASGQPSAPSTTSSRDRTKPARASDDRFPGMRK